MSKRFVLSFTLSLALALNSTLLLGKTSIYAEDSETNNEASLTSQENKNSKDKLKIKILGQDGWRGKIRMTERDRYSSWHALDSLFDEFNLEPEFEIVAREQYRNTIQTRIASSSNLPDFADITPLGDASILKMAKNGLILPIDEAINKYSDGTAVKFFAKGSNLGDHSWALSTAPDGHVYWLTQIQTTTYKDKLASTNYLTTIRKDWLDELGLKVPETTDEFYNCLKQFQENDMNKNGIKDEVMSVDFSNFSNGLAQSFGLVFGLTNFIIEDGNISEVTSPWHQSSIKDYFNYLIKLREEGLIDPTVIGATEDNKNIENNKAAALVNYTMASWDEAKVSSAKAYYYPLKPLSTELDSTPLLTIEPPRFVNYRHGFTSACQNQEAIARLVDLLCSDKYIELTQWGIEGETFEIKDGKKELLPITSTDAYEQAYNEGKVLGDFLWTDGTLPKRRFVDISAEIEMIRKTFPEKAIVQEELLDSTYPQTVMGTECYLPVLDDDTLELKLALSSDLTTRSKELAANLILGEESMDDFDILVEELDELGLKKLLEIENQRLDRAKELGIIEMMK